MQTGTKTSKPDLRRTLTCAALATITTLGMFSLVANLMTPMFAGIRLLASEPVKQQTEPLNYEDTVCVQTARTDGAADSRPSVI
jgi:hypothetical protein